MAELGARQGGGIGGNSPTHDQTFNMSSCWELGAITSPSTCQRAGSVELSNLTSKNMDLLVAHTACSSYKNPEAGMQASFVAAALIAWDRGGSGIYTPVGSSLFLQWLPSFADRKRLRTYGT